MNATLKIHSAESAAQSVQLVLGNILERISRLAQQVSKALREEGEAQLAIEQLNGMNERQLRDIGLTRSDIEPAVRGSAYLCR